MTGERNNPSRVELSLAQLALQVKQSLSDAFPGRVWVRGETSDLRVHPSGHCYMELVEKNERSGQVAVRMRAVIWASSLARLKPFFELETGRPFASGIRILVRVTVEYHETYGLSLSISDIDPSYTVGDMARRRMEIIRRLEADGILTMNRRLPMPALPSRIAVVTSPTAAGYGDFIRQLADNPTGFVFYCKLFSAVMQGERSEDSIIAALDRIFANAGLFDAVVIIRGGGAASELSCFDSYRLAADCAQFPLPIVTGIGHERDETVLDLVAHTRMKTPTAVAEFLIGRMSAASTALAELERNLLTIASNDLLRNDKLLRGLASRLPSAVSGSMERRRAFMRNVTAQLPLAAVSAVNRSQSLIARRQGAMMQAAVRRYSEGIHFIEIAEQFVRMASPQYTLQRGYSLTLKNNRIVKQASNLSAGDEITTRFADGEATGRISAVTISRPGQAFDNPGGAESHPL
ncbi:MAG: exodeoxyribonuclease VII large subunit [Tannerellaceae bacterium]|jgi:exodeoxyribonuclease VII large subunit|nr:exodeoxyribonuclease VII large subunit [Tannerellaceae bacterium]